MKNRIKCLLLAAFYISGGLVNICIASESNASEPSACQNVQYTACPPNTLGSTGIYYEDSNNKYYFGYASSGKACCIGYTTEEDSNKYNYVTYSQETSSNSYNNNQACDIEACDQYPQSLINQ